MSRPSLASRDVVLLLSYESVGDVVRRGYARPPDRLLRTLACDPSVERLLVVGPYRSRLVKAAKTMLGRREPELPFGDAVTTIEPLRLRRRDPTSTTGVERSFAHYDAQVARAAEAAGLDRPAVISFHPLAAGFAPATWARSVTYYARDDWAALPAYRPWWPVCREAYDRIRERRRGVVAVSQVLLDRLAPTGPSTVLANGIDAGEWADPGPPPAWFTQLPGPRFVYVGTLDDRLDLGAIDALATGYGGGSIVLMGPMPSGSPLEGWRRPNVHVVASRGRPEVVSVVHAADACLLTHRTTPLTQAMSPLKLYEYLAGGRPVVATDLGPVRDIDRRVVLVEGDDVVGAAERALAVGPASEAERSAFVEANSWAERHRQVLELAFR